MDLTAARAELEDLLQWRAAPALSVEEVDRLAARLPQSADAVGLLSDTAGYTPTYTSRAVAAQAAQGWLMKAGKVAGETTASLGGGIKFEDEVLLAHCLTMADRCAAQAQARAAVGGFGSVPLVTAATARP